MKSIHPNNFSNSLIGMYIKIMRNDFKQTAKILSLDGDIINLELIDGKDKGRAIKCEFSKHQHIDVFSESELILALMDN